MSCLSRSPRVLLVAALGGLAALAHALTVEEALERCLRRQSRVNVLAILQQRDLGGDGTLQTVRVERDRMGRSHHLVIAPLRLQGTEGVDDGRTARVYWPDQNAVMIQDSPLRTPCDAEWRMGLVRRNYRLRFGSAARVAGRATRCVVAAPKDARLETRRYYVDAKTDYPLRLEIVRPGGGATVAFDTKEIEYPAKMDASRFRMTPVGSPREFRYTRPKRMAREEAARVLGFSPLLPHRMPMGFALQEIQTNDGDRWRSAVVRITDGLVRATVYQWRAREDEPDLAAMEGATTHRVGGLRLTLVAELPANLRSALLRSFVLASLREEPMDLWTRGSEPSPFWPLLSLSPNENGDFTVPTRN